MNYKSVRISPEAYNRIKKILHKQELNSLVEVIDYLTNKELKGE